MSGEEYFKEWWKFIDKNELGKVIDTISKEYKVHKCLPDYKSVFKVFNVTPYSNFCQLWLGQNPYCNPLYPTGVAFANPNNVLKTAPSLNVLKNSILGDVDCSKHVIFANDLSHLSRQGILLLNSGLTVIEGQPYSHLEIWREFMKKLLIRISEINPGIIYVLWGKVAQSLVNFISPNNIVYKMPHPAWYARNDKLIDRSFFMELSNTNYKYYGRKIDWYIEEEQEGD